MEELAAYRLDLLDALDGVVAELEKIAAALPNGRWYEPIDPDGRTPHSILFHLCALESQVFATQLPRILAEDTPTLPVFDDEGWMAAHYHPSKPAAAILDEIKNLRRQELAWLNDLAPAGWSCLARHPWWGMHTLQWWVELQVEYSYQHLKQLSPLANM